MELQTSFGTVQARNEFLNVELFFSLADARQKLRRWHDDFNQVRPHSPLADRTPNEFAALWNTALAGGSGEHFALSSLNTASTKPHQGFAPPADAALDTAPQKQKTQLSSGRSARPNRTRNQSHSIESLVCTAGRWMWCLEPSDSRNLYLLLVQFPGASKKSGDPQFYVVEFSRGRSRTTGIGKFIQHTLTSGKSVLDALFRRTQTTILRMEL